MTPNYLLNALKDVVETAVKDYRLEMEDQQGKSVSVYVQHIPDAEFQDNSFYPLVIISLQKAEDKDEDSEATVGMTFGVYGESKTTWQDLLSIMERVRQHILNEPLLAKRFQLEKPTTWETIENQPYPFWFSYATLKYRFAQPVHNGYNWKA